MTIVETRTTVTLTTPDGNAETVELAPDGFVIATGDDARVDRFPFEGGEVLVVNASEPGCKVLTYTSGKTQINVTPPSA